MNFLEEFNRRIALIDKQYGCNIPKPRYQREVQRVPIVKYDLMIKDLEGKTVKELAWGLSLKECLTLGKLHAKSKLIKESEGLYSLQYVKIERGLYEH